MPTTRPRQFQITHHATGLVAIVNGREYRCRNGDWSTSGVVVAAKIGFRSPADCSVRRVPLGQEQPLPFDGDIPLILRPRRNGIA